MDSFRIATPDIRKRDEGEMEKDRGRER